jgi:dihydrofolate reductase
MNEKGNHMRKIIQLMQITPDGFCNHNNVIADEESHKFANEIFINADTVLFGRVTYGLFENYWPSIAKNKTASDSVNEFAEIIDNIDKIVFSKTMKKAEWEPTTIMNEISKDEIVKLKQKPGKNIVIAGSPTVVEELTRLGLIDEYLFLVNPILPGNGKRLFEKNKNSSPFNLMLTGTRTFQSGVVVLRYER